MKRILFLWILPLLCFGCAGREAAFQEWKQYLATTSENALDAQEAARLMGRVWKCEKDHILPSMWEHAGGTNQVDAVAACSILTSFAQVPPWTESDQLKTIAEQIDSNNLLNHMNSMETNGLSARWQDIHRSNIASLKEILEPSPAGGVLKAAPEE